MVGKPTNLSNTSPPSRIEKSRAQPTRQRPRADTRSSNSVRTPLRKLSSNRLLQTDTSQTERKDSGMIRPLARRQTIDGDMFKVQGNVHVVATKRLHNYAVPHSNRILRDRMNIDGIKTVTNVPMSAEDINEKISKMLAASEALKPGSGQPPDSAGSKGHRMMSTKVLKKISSAWGKMHAKNTDVEEGSLNHLQDPAKSTQLRINGGIIDQEPNVWLPNLQKIKRKPLPKNSLLMNGLGTPLVPRDARARPQFIHHRLQRSVDESSELSSIVGDPFDSEVEFESNLENRILSTIPEASSTPRSLAKKRTPTNLDQEPGHYLWERAFESSRETESLDLTEDERYQAMDIQTGQSHTHSVGDLQYMGIKKHPSPDKHFLAALSKGFQQYSSLKAISAREETLDELADRFVPPPRTSFAEEALHPVSRFSSTTTIQSDAMSSLPSRPVSPCTPWPATRIPRPIEGTASPRVRRRQGPPFRPSNKDADSPDELQ